MYICNNCKSKIKTASGNCLVCGSELVYKNYKREKYALIILSSITVISVCLYYITNIDRNKTTECLNVNDLDNETLKDIKGYYQYKNTENNIANNSGSKQDSFSSINPTIIENKSNYNPAINNDENNLENTVTESNEEPKTQVDITAQFPGGDHAFFEYLKYEFAYPIRCQEDNINGSVNLRFIVDITGRISDIQVLYETNDCPEFTKEAIRVLMASKRWIPAQIDGNFTKSWRELKININAE